MKAVTLLPNNEGFALQDRPVPNITNPDQMLVKVAVTGICGTDVHVMHGNFPAPAGIIVGHETCGVIYKLGANCKGFKEGDRVGVDPALGCNSCRYCKRGKPNGCPEGGLSSYIGLSKVDGGLCEYILIHREQAVPLEGAVPFRHAVLSEPMSTIIRGYDQMQPVQKDDDILILGCGIIGLLSCTLLQSEGFTNLAVSQRSLDRRELLRKQCPGVPVWGPDDLEVQYLEKKGEREWGFDCIFETTGNPDAIKQAMKYLKFGGKVVIFGCSPPGVKMEIEPFEMFAKEITLVGAMIQPNTYRRSVEVISKLSKEGRLNFDHLGIETFSLDDYKDGLDKLASRKIAKAMIIMQE